MIGYAVALALGIRGRLWAPMRFVVLATTRSPRSPSSRVRLVRERQINGFVLVVALWAVLVAWALAQVSSVPLYP